MDRSAARWAHFRLLARLGASRFASAFRRPSLPMALGAGLPLAVVVSGLWTLGRIGVPEPADAAGGVTLGMLVAGAVSFLSYGVLFGGSDRGFLRGIGIEPGALFLDRCVRLAVLSLLGAAALGLPYLAAGMSAARPALIGFGAAAVALGAAAWTYAAAARAVVGEGTSVLAAGMQDPELARVAPLVYAPLLPFLLGAAFGGFVGAAEGLPLARALLSLPLAAAGIALGTRRFAPAAPRFLARAYEMGYTPPPQGEGFRVGRGLSGLLPARAAAVWVRDATVANRRFTWAARVTWPIAILSIVVLARWGGTPASRAWVIATVGLALLLQGAAIVGLGLLERHGARWIDRSSGLAWWERFLGRWAWGWGLSLWLLVPVALAWSWWSGAPGGWVWPFAGAFTAGLAATASLLNAERR